MKNFYKHIALLFLLAIVAFAVKGQVNRTKMVGAYVYNFSRYTTWPDEAKLDSFRILLISDNNGLIAEFNDFSKKLKAKAKAISLTVNHSLQALNPPYPNLVFIDNNNSGLLAEILKQIGDNPILVVTEYSTDKQQVMINLYDSQKQELLFEVNKANIINHNLKIDPEILLLGGTEIDVARLFRTSQKEMEQLQLKMTEMTDSLVGLKSKITGTVLQIKKQQEQLKQQENLLVAQRDEIESGKGEIAKQELSIENQINELDKQKEQIEIQNQSINDQLIDFSEQKSYIEQQQIEIKKGKAILDSLVSEIGSKNMVLNAQTEIIDRQKQILILAVIAGLLALIVIVSVVNGYRNKIRKNRLLTEQKEEIESINSKLVSTNRSLYQTLGQLKDTQSQLVSSEKMASLGVLTAGIAHEINNPVNFIYTGINSLRKDYEDLISIQAEVDQLINDKNDIELITKIEQVKKENDLAEIIEIIPQTIADISIGAERAADIIRGLRNFSRIDNDSMQFADVHEGIESALLLLRNKFKNYITVQKDYRQLPKIECYPGKLNQAFLNIISNSIDAIEKEGKITIATSSDNDNVYISIEDNGRGISAENLNKIFDPFFTTKNVGKGVGLGLSITFGIIQEHRGKVEVNSTENRGSIFKITLPCKLNN